ncbi:hypothetical protein HDE_02878 [Halotydeus destructor]|nr:hypothetical protein HDE_02878 [Halotydeus destructor]
MSEIENSMHKVIQSYLVHIGANEMVFTGLVNLYIRRTCDLKERQATLDTFAVYMKKSLKMNNSVASDIALHWIQSTPFELTVENEQKVFMLLDLFVRLEGQLLIDLTVALLKRFWKDEQGFRWLQQCFLKFKNNQTAKRLENLYEKNTELLLDKLIEAVLDDDASQRKFDKGQNYLDSVFICLGKELAFNPMTNLVTKLVRLYPLDNYQQLVKSVSKDAFAYCGQLYGSKKSSEVFNLELLTSIYPKLYVSIMNGCCSFDEFRTAAKNLLYMVDLTRSEGTIFSRSRHHIVYELLSCIEGKQDFAPRILSVVRQFDVKESKNKSGFASSSEPISTLEDVLNYAQRRGSVQGYIVNLTGKIKKASDIEKYEKQVRSLAFILLHLENRTDQLDRTISAFLNKLIEKNDNCDIVFDLYDAFVKKISTSTLQERLCEVSKDMISLIYSRPHRVAGILEELVSKALALNLEKEDCYIVVLALPKARGIYCGERTD